MRALAQDAADDLQDPVSFVRQLHKPLPFLAWCLLRASGLLPTASEIVTQPASGANI